MPPIWLQGVFLASEENTAIVSVLQAGVEISVVPDLGGQAHSNVFIALDDELPVSSFRSLLKRRSLNEKLLKLLSERGPLLAVQAHECIQRTLKASSRL